MKKSIHITVPKPCHEDWNSMTPSEQGRHCQVCTKNVTDFTSFTNEQLIKYFENTGNLCGRFAPHQLNKTIQLERKEKGNWLGYIASTLFAIFSLSSISVTAQEKVKHEQLDTSNIRIGKTENLSTISKVKGIIKDQNDLPLPGVNIFIKGNNTRIQTDIDGKFELKANPKDTVVVSYLGMKTHTFIVKQGYYNITLEEDIQVLGGVGIILGQVKRRSFFGRIFVSMGNIFRRK